MGPQYFRPGDVVLWKEVRDGFVRHAAPMRVVVDTAE